MSAISTAEASPAHRAADPDKASVKVWIAVIGGLIGAFMAILNIQITNASLADIEGGIGTGADNGAWISTAYLVGEIIVIPLTAYLSQVFSFRRVLLVNATLFLVFSVACAFAGNLGQMIVLRGIQGFTGGVLIPMAFTLILTKLPNAQKPLGTALFAITATFAPAIGPTIGGYLTENLGWQWIFFVNVVPGAVMIAALIPTLEAAPMNLKLLAKGDWAGIITMSIGLGALQTVLEEGNKDDWFGSPFIVRLSIVAAVSLALFAWIELTTPHPAVNLRLLTRRNFAAGSAAMTLMGFGLYGSVFLLPQYLARVAGYNAEQIGMVVAWTGIPQLVVIPFLPRLMKRFDIRLIVFVGLLGFGIGCLLNLWMSPDYQGNQFLVPNVVRAVGQALALAPLSALAMIGISGPDTPAASGIFNMLRNLGGALGTALLGTLITKREQFHSNIIGSSVTLFREEVRGRLAHMAQGFAAHANVDPGTAQAMAVQALGNLIRKQALIMGFGDAFGVLGALLIAAAFLALLARKGTPAAGGGGH